MHIVGEAKSPDALRNASDQFFEWVKPAPESELTAAESVALKQPSKAEPGQASPKLRPKFIVGSSHALGSRHPGRQR